MGTVTLSATLFGNAFYDSLTNLAHAAVRTNAYLFVNQKATANSNNAAGTLLRETLDSGFNGTVALSNTLNRVFSAGTATGEAALSNVLGRVFQTGTTAGTTVVTSATAAVTSATATVTATTTAVTNATTTATSGANEVLNVFPGGLRRPERTKRPQPSRRFPNRKRPLNF